MSVVTGSRVVYRFTHFTHLPSFFNPSLLHLAAYVIAFYGNLRSFTPINERSSVYDPNNDLLPKSFRNLLSQNCLARHGIITRQNNLIPQSRPRTTISSKLPKHNCTRIWNKTGSTLAHGKNKLTFKRLLKNRYLEAYETHIKCTNPRCTDCCDK